MGKKISDKQILQYARQLVARQKKDDGLFFIPKHITEIHLQRALKELHCIIEGDIYFKDLPNQN